MQNKEQRMQKEERKTGYLTQKSKSKKQNC